MLIKPKKSLVFDFLIFSFPFFYCNRMMESVNISVILRRSLPGIFFNVIVPRLFCSVFATCSVFAARAHETQETSAAAKMQEL